MKSKVTLKEIVGTKIIYAILLVSYYWMWARRDWHDYYDVIQNAVVTFTIVFFLIQARKNRPRWQFTICAEQMRLGEKSWWLPPL